MQQRHVERGVQQIHRVVIQIAVQGTDFQVQHGFELFRQTQILRRVKTSHRDALRESDVRQIKDCLVRDVIRDVDVVSTSDPLLPFGSFELRVFMRFRGG